MNEYSSLKAAWHLDRVKELRRGDRIVPTQVQLVLSDLCNQSCDFCSYRMDGGYSTQNFGGKNPNRRIPTEKAIEILRDCEELGVQAIQFTGGGEPTAHPDHIHIFRRAQELGLKTGLVTNGVILKDLDTYRAMDWIRVSIDAGTKETYRKTRKSDLYHKAMEHLGEIAKMGGDCVVGVGFVITPDNWVEIEEATAQFRDLGVDYVRLTAVFSRLGHSYYGSQHWRIRSQIARAKELQTDTFRVHDLFGLRWDDLSAEAPDHPFCGYQHFNAYIGGDLKVYRCCTTAYTNQGEVGDLSAQSFRQWWSSEESHHQYFDFDARTCEVCQFNDKNQVIRYLVDPHPTHVEFV